ncbi:amidohydrolase family protein [Glaciibacter psychrotolerans]|uniref:L-fuconolactonase n=1 Tax=Glaciibacter psychrotolerans TaxID=670054 RepID=A0A7Z0J716_9MICO|nr:amidohydrolase family protein [Leifsonia psychrotolerans]NYJ21142.1 L-fuconolactonase [Leifsonia psychrotolerans]
MIDSHLHLWKPAERAYSWIPAGTVLDDEFGPERARPELQAAGVDGAVLVQAADSYEDTFYMLSVAAKHPEIAGVVGWVPLDRPAEAEAALELFRHSPVFAGVRNLTHDYADELWIMQPAVTETLELLVRHRLTLDVVCTTPQHLDNVAALAMRHPQLTIVLDHLANPGIADEAWEPWADQMAAVAAHPNVIVKYSGVTTSLAGRVWTAASWQRYLDHVLAAFGADRIMMGSDWPVSLLGGDYQQVWAAQLDGLAGLTDAERRAITHDTAARTYALTLG